MNLLQLQSMHPSISDLHKRTLAKKYLSVSEVKELIRKRTNPSFDVRLLNELLFHVSLEELLAQLESFSYYNPIGSYSQKEPTRLSSKAGQTKNLEVALIGTNVFHFVIPYIMLTRSFKIKVVWVKEKSLSVASFVINSFIISLLKGMTIERHHITSDKLASLKRHIVFHKLNFIIPREVIELFPKGIINDHWGTLPYYRGRSTFEYQKLFNHRRMFTNHLIAEGIDSGDIISFAACGPIMWWSKYILLFKRIRISALRLGFDSLDQNNLNEGATFYKMHKDLTRLLSYASPVYG